MDLIKSLFQPFDQPNDLTVLRFQFEHFQTKTDSVFFSSKLSVFQTNSAIKPPTNKENSQKERKKASNGQQINRLIERIHCLHFPLNTRAWCFGGHDFEQFTSSPLSVAVVFIKSFFFQNVDLRFFFHGKACEACVCWLDREFFSKRETTGLWNPNLELRLQSIFVCSLANCEVTILAGFWLKCWL